MKIRAISKKYPRNAACPCNSGLKYKQCCIDKGFKWELLDNGEVAKVVPHPPGINSKSMLEAQLIRFKTKFGRHPNANDPIFFDPDENVPTQFSEEKVFKMISEGLRAAGVNSDLIYAAEKTGMMVSEANYDQWSDSDIQEWNDAINEYHVKRALEKEDYVHEEARLLKRLYRIAQADDPSLTHNTLAKRMNITQGSVSHFLNGRVRIPLERGVQFAKLLGANISDFSPRLERRLKEYAESSQWFSEKSVGSY